MNRFAKFLKIFEDKVNMTDTISFNGKTRCYIYFKELYMLHLDLYNSEKDLGKKRVHMSAIIIFAQCYLESLINEKIEYYSIIKSLSEDKQKELECEPVNKKWKILYKNTFNKNLDRRICELLAWLNYSRNLLIHNKPWFKPITKNKVSQSAELLDDEKNLDKIDELLQKIDKIHLRSS